MHPTSILKGIIKIKMVTGTEAEAAVTSAVAERSHSSKIKAQPKRRRTLPHQLAAGASGAALRCGHARQR